jgi:hypothetical protein
MIDKVNLGVFINARNENFYMAKKGSSLAPGIFYSVLFATILISILILVVMSNTGMLADIGIGSAS